MSANSKELPEDTMLRLAHAFLAAADQMREPAKQGITDRNGFPYPESADAVSARRISADVLKAIGDVYMGQAVQHA